MLRICTLDQGGITNSKAEDDNHRLKVQPSRKSLVILEVELNQFIRIIKLVSQVKQTPSLKHHERVFLHQ